MSTKYMPCRVDEDTYSAISALAAANHVTQSEMLRRLLRIALDKELAKESVDFVREQIHDEIQAECRPQFDRLAKLTAKIGYQSVANFYLLAHIMDTILPASKRVEFDDIKQRSKMMAVAYLKLSEKEFSEFMKSEDQALDMLGL